MARKLLFVACAVALLLGVYAGAGFALAPYLIKQYLPKFVHEKLERKAEVADVEFNPFKLRLVARGFKFTEADGRPLAAFDEAVLDLDAGSLTQWALVVSEIRLGKPAVTVEISKNGKLNWLAVIDKLKSDKPPSNDPPPRFLIEQLKITQGRVDFLDRKADYENSLVPIDFEISDFSTLPKHRGPYSLAARTGLGGIIKWRGEISANPIEGTGELALEQISLPSLAKWLKALPGAEVKSGKFAARVPYRFAYADAKVTFSIGGAETSVSDLDIKRQGGETLLKMASLEVGKINADIDTREVTIDAVRLSGGHVGATRGADGTLDWQQALGAPASREKPAAAPPANPPTATDATKDNAAGAFKLTIKDIALDKISFKFNNLQSPSVSTTEAAEFSLHSALAAQSADGVLTANLESIKLGASQLTFNAGGTSAQLATANLQSGLKLQSKGGEINAAMDTIVIQAAQLAYKDGGNEAQIASVEMQSGLQAVSRSGALNASLENTKVAIGKTGATWPGAGGTASLALESVTAQAVLRLKDANLNVSGAQLTLNGAAITQDGQSPVKLAQAGVSNVNVDVGARSVAIDRAFVRGLLTQVGFDEKGAPDLLKLAPAPSNSATAGDKPASAAWKISVNSTALTQSEAFIDHKAIGVAVTAQAIEASTGAFTSELAGTIPFKTAFSLKEGGTFNAQGMTHAGQGTLDANIDIKQLPLALAQPLLARQVKLKLASGTTSTQGRLTIASGGALKYQGGAEVADLKLVEDNGDLFASWKNVAATQMTVSLKPNLVEIAELRITEPNAKLLIEADRSLNAQRLLVNAPPPKPQANAAPATGEKPEAAPAAKPAVPVTVAAAPATEDFPVRIGRVRVQNGFLDFADLSLRPQFAAKIHELNGVITGISSAKNTRSQLELDGRVDEFGLARIRGDLNPFVPRENTDVNMVFRNIDLVSASPYAMKFAGYRIASGKISLDLHYRVRNSQLQADNKIVLDQLVLGERVDSPDAIRLPLELAIAILKDSDGKIDLGIPITGSLDDPQFSYGAVVWKALTNLLVRVVTAPFRALGSLFGGGGEKMESIDFDPGSARILPPEREKLKSVAQVLAKRQQLKLAVPMQYSEAADSAALRDRALRTEVLQKTGGKPGPDGQLDAINLQERTVRSLLRRTYTERFGRADYDKLKAEAEKGVLTAKPDGEAEAPVPIWRRAVAIAQGEPQVADSGAFYTAIVERLRKTQPLPDSALRELGKARSDAIAAMLKADGIDATRIAQPAGENVSVASNKLVPLKLALSAR